MMSKRKSENDPKTLVEYYDWTQRLPLITAVAFVLALALVMVRATCGEFLREAFDAVPGGAAAPHTGMPNTTLWLDLFCMFPAVLVLIRRALDRSYILRFTPAHAMILLLAIWALCSTFWSADKFAAIVTAFHFLSAAVVCWAASQLVRSWQRLRVVAALCAAVLAIVCAHGILYRTVELQDLQRMVERDKDAILKERNWTEDSFAWKQFQRKVVAGEMIGFYTSPNTTAAMVILLGVVTAALAAQRIRDRDEWAWPAILLLLMLPACYVLYYTGTRAALVTPILAAGLIFVGWKFGARFAQRRVTFFVAACAFATLVAAAIIGHGIYHGTLFHDSLTFRWKYWLGSFSVFQERWLFGVGYSNFGSSYLAHRVQSAAEEIKDPHNIFVRSFVELGVIGGALMIGFLARTAWEITRPISPPTPTSPTHTNVGQAAVIAIVATIGAIICSIDFSSDGAYVFTELLRRLLYLGIAILVLAAGVIRNKHRLELDDRPAPLLLIGMITAVAVFFVHNLIDFAFWESGPMHVTALLIGALIGVRGESLAGRKKWNRTAVALAGVGLTAWLMAMFGLVVPLADAERRAQRADDALRANELRRAISGYKAAFDNAPIKNADYAFRAGRALLIENRDSEEAYVWLSQAIATNPRDAGYRLTRASSRLLATPERRDLVGALEDFASAIAIDPNNLQSRLDYASTLEAAGKKSEAAAQYDEVIKRNELYDATEPKRLAKEEIEKLKVHAAQLRR